MYINYLHIPVFPSVLSHLIHVCWVVEMILLVCMWVWGALGSQMERVLISHFCFSPHPLHSIVFNVCGLLFGRSLKKCV